MTPSLVFLTAEDDEFEVIQLVVDSTPVPIVISEAIERITVVERKPKPEERVIVPREIELPTTGDTVVERLVRLSKQKKEEDRPEISNAEEDRQLVRRFLDGDESAFETIVVKYKPNITSVVGNFLRKNLPGDIDDITMDTFIRAHKGLAKFRGDSSLKTWLHRIAVNLARNRYWYWKRRGGGMSHSIDAPLSEDGDATFHETIASDSEMASDEFEVKELGATIDRLLLQLPSHMREILHLRCFAYKTYDEISVLQNVNVGTVKSRIARAREALLKKVLEACPAYANLALTALRE